MIFDPLIERQNIQTSWAELLSTVHGGTQANVEPLHPYFFDHYGYLLHLSKFNSLDFGASEFFYSCHLPSTKKGWRERVEEFVHSCTAWSDQTRPNLAGQVPQHTITDELLEHWSDWLSRLGVSIPANQYELPRDITWEDFFKDSVHFPDRPAIAGPTFFIRTTTNQQKDLIQRYGSDAPTALYVVLLRIHEKSHFLQSGCPLINELSLSALWGRFLTEFDQWLWQMNSETKVAFNLEWEHTRRVELDPEQWAQVFTDSFLGIESILGPKAQHTYDSLRALSHDFFLRKSGYTNYVQKSCNLLNERIV